MERSTLEHGWLKNHTWFRRRRQFTRVHPIVGGFGATGEWNGRRVDVWDVASGKKVGGSEAHGRSSPSLFLVTAEPLPRAGRSHRERLASTARAEIRSSDISAIAIFSATWVRPLPILDRDGDLISSQRTERGASCGTSITRQTIDSARPGANSPSDVGRGLRRE
jgi:hypothetical protein